VVHLWRVLSQMVRRSSDCIGELGPATSDRGQVGGHQWPAKSPATGIAVVHYRGALGGTCWWDRRGLCRLLLEATTFTLAEATPNPEALIVGQCVFEAFNSHLTGLTHTLCLPS
jgi:hypothetical protein